MTRYVIDPPQQPSIAVADSVDRFPVRRIFCVGRNYAAHVREMGRDPEREPPFFFTKPADAVVDDGATIPYPLSTENLHHEAELVAVIGRTTDCVSEDRALDHVWGYAIGNDLTRRDLQLKARDTGRPWDTGKAFDRSAPVGPAHPVSKVGHPATGAITLHLNGEQKQSGDLDDMIWNVPEMIAILSRLFVLEPGDLIMTGTPAGVGPMQRGDTCVVRVEGLGELTTRIAA